MPAVTLSTLRRSFVPLKSIFAILVTALGILLTPSPANANPGLIARLKSPIGRALLASEEGRTLARTMGIRHRALELSSERIASLHEGDFRKIFDELAESVVTRTKKGNAGHVIEEQIESIARYVDDTINTYRDTRKVSPEAAAKERRIFGLTLDEHVLVRLLAERRLALRSRSWISEALQQRTNFVSRARGRYNTRNFFLNKEPPEIIKNLPPPRVIRSRQAAEAGVGSVRRATRWTRNLYGEMRSCLANQPDSAASKDWMKFLYQEIGLGWALTTAFHGQREGVNHGARDAHPLTNPADFLSAIQVGYKHVRLRDLGTDIIMGTISDLAKYWGMDRVMRHKSGMGFLDPNLRFDVVMVRGWSWQQSRNLADMAFFFILPTKDAVPGADPNDIDRLEEARAQLLEDSLQRYQFNTIWSGLMAPISPSLVLLNQGILCMVPGNSLWHKVVRGLTGVSIRGVVKTHLSYTYFRLRNEYMYGDNPTPIDETERQIQDILRAPMAH